MQNMYPYQIEIYISRITKVEKGVHKKNLKPKTCSIHLLR